MTWFVLELVVERRRIGLEGEKEKKQIKQCCMLIDR